MDFVLHLFIGLHAPDVMTKCQKPLQVSPAFRRGSQGVQAMDFVSKIFVFITILIGLSTPSHSFGSTKCEHVIRLGVGESARYLLPSDANSVKRVLFSNLWFESQSQKEMFKKLINELTLLRNKGVETQNKMDFEIEFPGNQLIGARFQFQNRATLAGHLSWIPPQMNMKADGARQLRIEFLNWIKNDPNLPKDFWQTFSEEGPNFYARTGSLQIALSFENSQNPVDTLNQQRHLRNFIYMGHMLSRFLDQQ